MSKTPTPPAWSGFFITQTQAASNRGLFLFVQAEHRVSKPAVGQPVSTKHRRLACLQGYLVSCLQPKHLT